MQEGDIIAAIAALSSVKALRASVYWGKCPDPRDLPYIVALRVGGGLVTTHQGGTSMDNPRIQFDCVALTMDNALSLRSAVNTLFNGVRQDKGNTRIYSAIHQSNIDQFDGGPNFYVASTDILFQTIPIS
jgi:hypothetical protein